MKLTFEKTRGTRTIYFPLETSDDRPADFAVVIRPFRADPDEQFDETDEFEAGVAWCSPVDQFVKRKGRAIAFERLNSEYRLRGSAAEIIAVIMEKMHDINIYRTEVQSVFGGPDYYMPDMDEDQIELDMIQVMSYDALSAYFTKKEENRGDQLTLEA